MEQTHTTSDLLRLLDSDGRPCSEVAAAVTQRFGGDAASQAWLCRTLSTLLRVRASMRLPILSALTALVALQLRYRMHGDILHTRPGVHRQPYHWLAGWAAVQ